MSRRQKLIFIALSLFPFVLAMSFRAVDNYHFTLELHKSQKAHTDYFPKPPGEEYELESEYTCGYLELSQDSLNMISP